MADDQDRGQKTEEASPRRRQEAREKGQVAMSTELVAALTLLAWVGLSLVVGPRLAGGIGGTLTELVRQAGAGSALELGPTGAGALMGSVGRETLLLLAMAVLPLFGLGLLVAYGQVGLRVTPKALTFDLARVNPIKGFGRLFSARSAVRTALALAKIVVVTGTMAALAWGQIGEVASLGHGELGPVLAGAVGVMLRCALGAVVAILALALFDLAFQRWQHERDLRMSKQELRDELKQTEGDPHLKARIRAVQREMATRRMMAEVPRSTVVVTNPTHFAVALLYERDSEGKRVGAPRVTAKGADHMALRIKEVAREAGVVCYEDAPLARALHAQVEIGDEIPVELYQAVASVLAYVFRVQGIGVAA